MDGTREIAEPKSGYLKEDFRYFHIKDQKNVQFEYHYHDFNKIIIFISGDVAYLIEGKAYKLKPWDILLVSKHEIHKPVIDAGQVYERIVIWINQSFLDKHSIEECNLSSCFHLASKNKYFLLRPSHNWVSDARYTLSQLEETCKSSSLFGNRILKNSLFMQLIVHINREFLNADSKHGSNDIAYNERIDGIINYIKDNLGSDLSIENLSAKFFISKYYLMHHFKQQTGHSLHNYILQKRLIAANELIKEGKPAYEACSECGFGDYSSFVRAFKKMFGLSPRNHYKKNLQLANDQKNSRHF